MWQHGHDDSLQDTRAAIYLLFAVAVTSDHFDWLFTSPKGQKVSVTNFARTIQQNKQNKP